jgi:hypothetical protein
MENQKCKTFLIRQAMNEIRIKTEVWGLLSNSEFAIGGGGVLASL